VAADLTVLIVCTADSARDDVAATVASVRAETGDDTRLCMLARDGGEEGATVLGLPAVGPGAVLAACDLLAFARPGDRWREGAFIARRRPLVGHPEAVMSVAGHAVVAADGTELRAVRAPLPGADPAELVLRPSIEPSSVLVLPAAVTPTALSLLARPGGPTVLWARIARAHGFLPSLEVAASVPVERAVCADEASIQAAALEAARVLWDHNAEDVPRAVDDELRSAIADVHRLHMEIRVRDSLIERLSAEVQLRDAKLRAAV
jgi:hypothetical protein